jgi:predicted HTH domain antitoxin
MSDIDSVVEAADLQNFLSAEVGMGASGERLTVALALSHLGFDPDVEARRLSTLSRAEAAEELAKRIASTPGSLQEFSTAIILSEHLVSLLPVQLLDGLSDRRGRGHTVRQTMKLSDYQQRLNKRNRTVHQIP